MYIFAIAFLGLILQEVRFYLALLQHTIFIIVLFIQDLEIGFILPYCTIQASIGISPSDISPG